MKNTISLKWFQLFFLFLLTGCVAAPVALLPVALPALISGAGGGISYTFTNIAYKTTTFPAEDVKEATLKAFEKMSIKLKWVKDKKNSIKIKGLTRKLTIIVNLDKMTPTLTKIQVNAKRHIFLKDKTTAYEIIYQTELFLAGEGERIEKTELKATPQGQTGVVR